MNGKKGKKGKKGGKKESSANDGKTTQYQQWQQYGHNQEWQRHGQQQKNQYQNQSEKKDNPDKDKECFYCKKKGHVKRKCNKRMKDIEDAAKRGVPFIDKDSTKKPLAAVQQSE